MIYCLLLGVETFQEFFNNNKNERKIERRNVFRFLLSPLSFVVWLLEALDPSQLLAEHDESQVGRIFFVAVDVVVGGVAIQRKFVAFCYGEQKFVANCYERVVIVGWKYFKLK